MLSRKALARINAALTMSDTVVHLPIRRVVALNIADQIREGYGYAFPEASWEKLDALLNFGLSVDFRAPTPRQTRFISYISDKVGISPTEEELQRKVAGELYIERYCDLLPDFGGGDQELPREG